MSTPGTVVDSVRVDTAPAAKAAVLPASLQGNATLGTWLRVDPAGFVEVSSGKVEIGQGIVTALAQIAADELDLDFSRVRMMPVVTGASPDEGVTSGSLSIQHSGTALRLVCAQARGIYLGLAAARHGVTPDTLRVVDGVIHCGADRIGSYWELADPALLQVPVVPGTAVKPAHGYTLVGTSHPRDDIADKVFGNYRFIHDLVLPDMVHGRIVRPPSPAAVLLACPADEVRAWDGVLAVARSGSQLGVIATSEAMAERAAARLAKDATWDESATLPDERQVADWLRKAPSSTVESTQSAGAAESKPSRTLGADYSKSFVHHASIGPSCALALSSSAQALTVWSHSQGVYNLRKDLGLALHMPESAIVVHHVQGAGCYGHNGADDVAFDAAWLARYCPGRPVRVQWSRADELCWSPLGPAMTVRLEADVDANGNVLDWRHQLWSPGHGLRPGRKPSPTLLGSWYVDPPFEHIASVDAARSSGGGADRNAEPLYAFPRAHLLCHRPHHVPLRTSALRSLGAFANVFAIESFMDELALACGRDPLAYRLHHLADPRALAVLHAVAEQAGWPGQAAGTSEEACGTGIGFARYKGTSAYCAVVADVEVTHRIRVRKLTIAVDVGLVINPDGVRQQIEGGAIQATSWALLEAARFDRTRLLSDSWENYPILRFADIPQVDVTILHRPEYASLGAGEASLGPTAAAIGNALFQALGVRVRDLPLTPERIIAAMED